jgi:RNA polymerase sigma-70 factor (ECF subfamily)
MIDDFASTLRAAKTGDEHAIAVLWSELNHRVVRYLRAREWDSAEDVASETWLTVASKLSSFEGNEVEFRAWLFTVARSRLVDWQRRARVRPPAAAGLDADKDRAAPDDTTALAFARIDRDAALALVGTLPTDQADVVLLRVLAGLDVERVAAIVGKRPGAVRMLQMRGLRRLREQLESVESREGVTR